METFHFKPVQAEIDRIKERMAECNPWWITFDMPVTRVFCEDRHASTAYQADYGVSWAGVGVSHGPRDLPTDMPGVHCIEFEAPVEKMAVEEWLMRPWMEVIRANGFHGAYRKAGTDKEYRF